jgi:hypothetical protein
MPRRDTDAGCSRADAPNELTSMAADLALCEEQSTRFVGKITGALRQAYLPPTQGQTEMALSD